MVFASFLYSCILGIYFSLAKKMIGRMPSILLGKCQLIYFLIGRIYFNQSEQCSTAVNSGSMINMIGNSQFIQIVLVPWSRWPPCPEIQVLEPLLKSSTESEGQWPCDLVCSIGMMAIPSLHKLLFWVDHNLLTAWSNLIPKLHL